MATQEVMKHENSSSTRAPEQKFLVVCGVDTIRDVHFFGNFLGFARSLQRLGVTRQFWSTFPIQQYFEQGLYDNIKFGRKDFVDNWAALEIYTKRNYEQRERFWTQYDASTESAKLHHDIISSIAHYALTLSDGDMFSVILIGHGSGEGIQLGNTLFKYESLVNCFERFHPGVRLNVILQSCKSGSFAHKFSAHDQRQAFIYSSVDALSPSTSDVRSPSGRYRNSKFSGAFLESLGFAHKNGRSTSWSLQDHLEKVEREGQSSSRPNPGGPIDRHAPQHSIKGIDLLTKFIDVLFNDYVDLSFTEANQTARRVITPTSAAGLMHHLPAESISLAKIICAAECLAEEMLMCPQDPPNTLGDVRFSEEHYSHELFYKKRKIGKDKYSDSIKGQMHVLRWRYRIQESFYLAMQALAIKHLLNPGFLAYPINVVRATKDVAIIVAMLNAFTIVQSCTSTQLGLYGLFEAPVIWLAVLIYRSFSDLTKIFNLLITTRILGEFDESFANSLPAEKIHFSSDALPAKPSLPYDLKWRPVIGFWLPIYLQDDYQAFFTSFYETYGKIENAYERCMGENSWGSSHLIKDSIAPWLEQRPNA